MIESSITPSSPLPSRGGVGRLRSASIQRSATKQGYLQKRPLKTGAKAKSTFMYRMKRWKSRWFVLHKTCLYYFKSAVDSQPLGSIPLDNIKIQCKEMKNKPNKKDRRYKFSIITPYATHMVAAESEQERDAWIEAIMTTCGANKISKTVDFITKLHVTVVEAQFDPDVIFSTNNSNNKQNKTQSGKKELSHECHISLNTSFQSFSTVSKFKTNRPIFNEQFTFDCPRFPVDLYVLMHVGELEDTVVKYTLENQETEEDVAKRKLLKTNSANGLMRMTLMEPQISIAGAGGSESGQYHVERTDEHFDLRFEGWFKVKRKEEESKEASRPKTFIVVDDDNDNSMNKPQLGGVVGQVYLKLEYIFEDLTGFPISVDNLLYSNKTNDDNQINDAMTARRLMMNRRYRQELLRISDERTTELVTRLEMSRKSKLAELKDKLAEEEENYKVQKQMMKMKEEREKQELEERLAQEERERLAQMQKELKMEEERRKQELIALSQKRTMEQEQAKIAVMMDLKRQKEEQMREAEEERLQMEQELERKKKDFEERMRREEEDLRKLLEDQLLGEQEERLLALERKLRAEEEFKKKQLKRDIRNLEAEITQKKEYMEMQELKKKNLEHEVRQEEKKRLRELQKQIKKEELEMLKSLQQKIKSEETQRVRELEEELEKMDKEQREEVAQRFMEERTVRREQLQSSFDPPPAPSSSLSSMWFGSGNDDDDPDAPRNVMSSVLTEFTMVGPRLKKIEANAQKSEDQKELPPSFTLATKLQETLLRRRQMMQQAREEESDDDYDSQDEQKHEEADSNVLLNMIAKKIAKIEKQSRFMANNDDDDDLFASDGDDSEEDW